MIRVKYTLYFLAVCFLIVGISSCNILSERDTRNDQLTINNDPATLNQRIQIINQEIILDSARAKSAAFTPADKFVHVANIQAPTDANGNRLSATSIELRAQKVYISYHLNGNRYAGAVDIIDVKDESSPSIVSSMVFDDTDINALEIEENAKILWVTGGRDVSSSGYNTDDHNGAIIGEIAIDKGFFEREEYRETPLPSFSGNDIVDYSSELYVAAGATGGGFYQLDKEDFNVIKRINNNFAKSIDKRQSDIIGLNLDADNRAVFSVMDFESDQVTNYTTPFTVSPVDGKNALEHTSAVTYAALGNQGVKGYKFNTSADVPVYEFNVRGEDVANGVTVDGKYVYIANGTDGLYITTLPRDGKTEPESVYSWKNGDASANFVKTDGKYIILANGTDGLNILKRENK